MLGNKSQYHLLQSLAKRGWPEDLLSHLLPRCGATEQDWQALISRGLIVGDDSTGQKRFFLSGEGKKALKNRTQWV